MRDYVTLGRSGLAVSKLCLGAMTFGTAWGWGADETESRAMVHRYLDWGGNFIDTANVYTNGESEEILGRLLADPAVRAHVVLGTKFAFNNDPADSPHGGGNGRKNARRSLDASLQRLGLEHIDIYWMHAWDRVTPVEEVVETLHEMVRSGKILHYGFSNVPAWYAVRAFDHAERHGLYRPIALQHEYSLVERSIEREHVPLCQQLGLGIAAWSPLAGGFLSGKYQRGNGAERGNRMASTGAGDRLDKDAAWTVLETVQQVACEIGRTAAEVSLAWAQSRPGITSLIIGARTMAQLDQNLAAADVTLDPDIRQRLDAVSKLEEIHPYKMFRMKKTLHGNARIAPWPSGPSG